MHLCKDVKIENVCFGKQKLQEKESMAEDLICLRHKRLRPVT